MSTPSEEALVQRVADIIDDAPIRIHPYQIATVIDPRAAARRVVNTVQRTLFGHPEDSCETCGHASDCATHNEPALPMGACNCSKEES